jgi:hypothetical protein
MRRYKFGNRWATPLRQYTGAWRRNPWINAVLLRSTASMHNDGSADSQEKTAIRVWEYEGGSLGTHRGIR